MASCIGIGGGSTAVMSEGLLDAMEEAIKECSTNRLQALLSENRLSVEQLAGRNLLHQAAWIGHYGCVQLLLNYGVEPDCPHTTNGCTPLHLAHFCTIENRDCYKTIQILVAAGADINGLGSKKCCRSALEHAVQHQRIDSVLALLREGCQIELPIVLMSIDVVNFEILEKLLLWGGECGPKIHLNGFWGEPLQKFITMPLKQHSIFQTTLKTLIRASLSYPYEETLYRYKVYDNRNNNHSYGINSLKAIINKNHSFYLQTHAQWQRKVEDELIRLYSNSDYKSLVITLIDGLIKNGFKFSRKFLAFDTEFQKYYLTSPISLLRICVLVLRSVLAARNGNVFFTLNKLDIAPGLKKNLLLHDLF